MNGFSAPAVLSLFIALFMRLPSLIDISRRGANANPLFWAAKSLVMNRSHRTKVLSSQISVLDCMIAVHSWLSRLLAPVHFSRIEKVGCGAILYVHWKLVRKSIWCESRISTSLACRTASQQATAWNERCIMINRHFYIKFDLHWRFFHAEWHSGCRCAFNSIQMQALDFFDWDFEFWSLAGTHASGRMRHVNLVTWVNIYILHWTSW
jgi:hypothetical protein